MPDHLTVLSGSRSSMAEVTWTRRFAAKRGLSYHSLEENVILALVVDKFVDAVHRSGSPLVGASDAILRIDAPSKEGFTRVNAC